MYLEVKEEENAYVVFDCCDVFDDFTKLITYKYKVSLFETSINENRIDFPLQSNGLRLSFPIKNHLEKKDGIIYISYDMSKIVEIKNILYIPIVRESQLSYIEKEKEEEFFNLINELSNKNKIQKFVTLFYFDKHKIDELYTKIILECKLRPIKHNLYNEIKTDEDYNNYLNIKEKVKYLEEKGIFKLEGIKKSIFENFNSVNIMYSSIAINEYIVHYLFNYYFKDINYANKNKDQCIYNPSTGEMLEILKQNRRIIKRNSNISIVENNKALLKTLKENNINIVVNEKYDKLSSPFLTLKQFNALRNAVFRHGLMSSHIMKEISFTLINVSLDMLEYFEYELLNEDNKRNEGINYNGFNLFVKNTTNDSIMLLSKIDNDNKAEYIDYKYGFINIYKNNKDVLEYCNNSISTGDTTI